MSLVNEVMGKYAWTEVAARRFMYTFPGFKDLVHEHVQSSNSGSTIECDITKHQLFKAIDATGIRARDLVIVHSGIDNLSRVDINAKQLLDYFVDCVGESRTLALPAFIKRNHSAEITDYNPKRSLCWTGMLPNLFLRYSGVVRSFFPLDSLASRGPLTEEMMRHNLETDLPHARGSAWEFCANHNALLLFVGASSSHNNPMIHVVEDVLSQEGLWPVRDWYKETRFNLITRERNREIVVRERRQFWSRFLAEHYFERKYKQLGFIKTVEVAKGLTIDYIPDSYSFIKCLKEEALAGDLVFHVPKKYRID